MQIESGLAIVNL